MVLVVGLEDLGAPLVLVNLGVAGQCVEMHLTLSCGSRASC